MNLNELPLNTTIYIAKSLRKKKKKKKKNMLQYRCWKRTQNYCCCCWRRSLMPRSRRESRSLEGETTAAGEGWRRWEAERKECLLQERKKNPKRERQKVLRKGVNTLSSRDWVCDWMARPPFVSHPESLGLGDLWRHIYNPCHLLNTCTLWISFTNQSVSYGPTILVI